MHYALFEIMLPALGRKHISEFHAKTRFRTNRSSRILGPLGPPLDIEKTLQNKWFWVIGPPKTCFGLHVGSTGVFCDIETTIIKLMDLSTWGSVCLSKQVPLGMLV